MPGVVSFKSITLPLKPQMIFSVNYVFLPSMILTIYSLTALLPNIVYSLESFLSEILKKPISLSKNILLYNFSEQTGNHNLILSKMASLIRLSSFQLRNKLISFNLSVTPSLLNEELYKIKTKFKFFLKKAYPDLSKYNK